MSEQRSAEWFRERLGCVSSSTIADVLAKPKKGSGEATTRKNLKAKLVCELLTGKRDEDFMSWDMQRGIQLEPLAVDEYEHKRDVECVTVGFVPHPTIPRSGASPDRLIGEDGLIEIKCPKMATHQEYILGGRVPTEYLKQMQWEMACTGRKWADFVSYHPGMPEHLQVFIARLKRDDATIAEIEDEVRKFNAEVDEVIEKLPQAVQP